MSASAHEFLELEARNNSENIQRSRNALEQERPLPPLPRNDISLEKVDESDDDDSEEDVDEVYSDEEDISDDEDVVNSMPKLLNGNNSNPENDAGFDADSTLPPSPSKTSNTSGFNSISSLESPTTPDSERYRNISHFLFTPIFLIIFLFS